MVRRLDELSAAQAAMDRRHAEWRAELEDLFADVIVPIVPLLAVASTGVVAPESWQTQTDQLGFRATIASPPKATQLQWFWGRLETSLELWVWGRLRTSFELWL